VDFSLTSVILLVLLGLAVGVFGTLVGAGGGFILAPVLLILYPHDSAETLSSISIAVVFFNALSGSIAYARQRRIDLPMGRAFGVATLPGSVAGAFLVGYVPRATFDLIMAVVLGALAVWLLMPKRALVPGKVAGHTHREIVDVRGVRYVYDVPVLRGVALSLVVGFVSSFLGIGGGVIHVPVLVQLLGFPLHVATATSHFVLAIMSGSATLTHLAQGSYHVGHGLRRALALSAGVVVGAQVGAWISHRTSARLIQRILSFALLAIALRLALTA
jgi:uncharacterized membrane protein YfcA